MSLVRRAKGVRTTVPHKSDPRAADLLYRQPTAVERRIGMASFPIGGEVIGRVMMKCCS